MKALRWSILVFLTVVMTCAALTPVAAATGRRFYLTKTNFDGDQAAQACAPGFHMASLWELYDVSNARYDRTLGATATDAGFGPPAGAFGWIRTGGPPDISSPAGIGNCNGWTSDDPGHRGTMIELPRDWENLTLGNPIGSWHTGTANCDFDAPVWCAQN